AATARAWSRAEITPSPSRAGASRAAKCKTARSPAIGERSALQLRLHRGLDAVGDAEVALVLHGRPALRGKRAELTREARHPERGLVARRGVDIHEVVRPEEGIVGNPLHVRAELRDLLLPL